MPASAMLAAHSSFTYLEGLCFGEKLVPQLSRMNFAGGTLFVKTIVLNWLPNFCFRLPPLESWFIFDSHFRLPLSATIFNRQFSAAFFGSNFGCKRTPPFPHVHAAGGGPSSRGGAVAVRPTAGGHRAQGFGCVDNRCVLCRQPSSSPKASCGEAPDTAAMEVSIMFALVLPLLAL